MSTRVLRQDPKKYPDLKTHNVEPDHLESPRTLRGVKYQGDDLVLTKKYGAGGKQARRSLGRLDISEAGPISNGNNAFALYTTKSGKVIEQDMRAIEINDSKAKSISKAQRKEAIRFRMNVIEAKAGVYIRKEDKAVIKRMAALMIDEQVPQKDLCAHNPYDNKKYVDLWNVWALRIAVMTFRTPSIH